MGESLYPGYETEEFRTFRHSSSEIKRYLSALYDEHGFHPLLVTSILGAGVSQTGKSPRLTTIQLYHFENLVSLYLETGSLVDDEFTKKLKRRRDTTPNEETLNRDIESWLKPFSLSLYMFAEWLNANEFPKSTLDDVVLFVKQIVWKCSEEQLKNLNQKICECVGDFVEGWHEYGVLTVFPNGVWDATLYNEFSVFSRQYLRRGFDRETARQYSNNLAVLTSFDQLMGFIDELDISKGQLVAGLIVDQKATPNSDAFVTLLGLSKSEMYAKLHDYWHLKPVEHRELAPDPKGYRIISFSGGIPDFERPSSGPRPAISWKNRNRDRRF